MAFILLSLVITYKIQILSRNAKLYMKIHTKVLLKSVHLKMIQNLYKLCELCNKFSITQVCMDGILK